MNKRQLRGVLIILLASLIWGAAFVAQSVGMEKIGPFTFSGIRIMMGAATLVPVMLVKDGIARKNKLAKRPFFTKREYIYGAALGVVLAVACNFQQWALVYTTPGKTAFITAMYMLFVPLAGIFLKKKVSPVVWGSVLLAVLGMYLLCVDPAELGLNFGDVLAFVCSLFFAVQILLIEKSGEEVDSVKLCFLEFFVCGIISTALMFIFEEPNLQDIGAAIVPLLYAGVLSGGVAYTLQIVGQRDVGPTVGSLLMSMESVFAVLTAWILIGEGMNGREIAGCVIMFVAIVLSQLSDFVMAKWKKVKENK